MLQRRIEFHPARKHFSFFNESSDFKIETLNPDASRCLPANPASSSSSSLPSKQAKSNDNLDGSLDPELSFRIPFRRIGAGLENLGNTCFLNSVLQCLTYTEPFVAYLQNSKHQNSCHIAGFCALCAIQKHVNRALQSTGRILAPKDLVSNLRCISRSFRNARQEDAHEYMINLLESMHKCCLPSGVPAESPTAYGKSLVHKIFGGSLRSQVKCMQCSYCSNKFDPFLDLSLEIVKAESLNKALMHFTAAEQLDGGEKQYKCERCKQKVKALKQLTVHKAPYVLTIHLKRFGHITGQKIDKKVSFGPTLDLKPFVSGSYEGDLRYTLYGVLVHAGWSTHSGHYYSYVRTSSGMWYSLDDNRVFQVNEKTVLEQKAYMLFYVRDRKTSAPTKPVDVVKKESILTTAVRNASCSTPAHRGPQNDLTSHYLRETVNTSVANQLNGTVKNGPPLKKVESVTTSAQHDMSSVRSTNTPVSKPESVPQCNGTILSELPAQGSDNSLVHMSDSTRNSTGNVPVVNNVTQTTLSSNVNPKDGNSLVVVSDAKQSVPDSLPNVSSHAAGMSSIMDGAVAVTEVHNDPSGGGSDVKSVKCDSFKPPHQPNSERETSKVSSKEGVTTSGTSEMKAPDLASNRKLKRKLLKCKVASMHLSTKLLYEASFNLRNQKKRKRIKRIKQKFVENQLSNRDLDLRDMGPSTSYGVNSSYSSKDSVSDPIKGGHGAAKKSAMYCNGDFAMADSNGMSKETTNDNKNVSYLEAKQLNKEDPSYLKHRVNVQLQNGTSSVLSGALAETTVGCWDGIEVSSSRVVEPNGADSDSIGYILDEWDEEYDRGKRKKLKSSKNNFHGPNLFQEIAMKKARPKKPRGAQYKIGSQPPFRI